MANINKIRVSGTTYDIQDINAPKVIELTQSEYDSLTTKDPNAFYVITDSEYNFDGYWTSAQTQSAITQSVSGKADTSAVTSVSDSLTAHTANTTVHVTAQDKTNWNAKSDFSGNYNDLSNKPTIPSKTSDLTNDSNFATTSDVQTATNDMATKTWVGQQGYLTQHQDISGKQDVSGMTAYTTTATTSALNDVVTAHTANTSIHVSAEQIAAWNAKSDFSGSYNDLTNKLSAGTNISIVDNVISATGGGGGMTEDDELLLSTALTDLNDRKIDASEVKSNYQRKGDYVTTSTLNTRLAEYETALDEQNVEEVTAYALNDLNERFGGLKIVKITESEYEALTTKDENTLYVVVADPS